MVERKTENGNDTFTILCDMFNGNNGYVEAKIRRSDGECEGDALFIDVTTNIHEKEGDYAPIVLDKQELRQLMSFLQYQYDHIK